MKASLGIPAASYVPGAVAGIIMSRYFHITLACGVVALLHFLAEWVYMGRPRRKFSLGLVAALFALTLIGANAIQPSLVRSNHTQYAAKTLPADRESAGKSFRIVSATGIALNILTIGGLVLYLWRVSSPSDTLRFVRPVQFRG